MRSLVKNLLAMQESSCNVGDTGSISGSGRSRGKEMATLFSMLAWRIPWTEVPGGHSPCGCKKSRMSEQLAHLLVFILTNVHLEVY